MEILAASMRTPRDRCLLLLGVYTGFRVSELLSLTVGDVLTRGDQVASVLRRAAPIDEGEEERPRRASQPQSAR